MNKHTPFFFDVLPLTLKTYLFDAVPLENVVNLNKDRN